MPGRVRVPSWVRIGRTESALLQLLLTLAILLRAPYAYAEERRIDPRESTLDEEARALFERGVAASRARDWASAEDAFRRSFDLVQRASTLTNHARALFELGRPYDALQALDVLAQLDPLADESAQRAALVTDLRQRAEAQLARLEITVDPPEAEVTIDGEPRKGNGRTRRLPLNPGRHSVEVAAPHHAPSTIDVNLAASSSAALSIRLEALAARVEGQAVPQQAVPQSVSAEPDKAQSPVAPDLQRRRFGAQPVTAPDRTAAYVAFGSAGVLLVAGAISGLVAQDIDQDFVKACGGVDDCDPALRPMKKRAEHYALAADVLFGATAAAAAVGAGFLLFSTSEGESVSASIGPRMVHLAFHGTLE